MGVSNVLEQLRSAAQRAGLIGIFGELTFEGQDVEDLQAASEGDVLEVGFGTADGPLGDVFLDLYGSGNPDEEGLSVGLRGWRLDEDVASV